MSLTEPSLTVGLLLHCSIEITVTDLGSSFRVTFPPCTVAETGFGLTVFGASKVLTLSTFGAVSVSPAADLPVYPVMARAIGEIRVRAKLRRST